MFKWRNRNKNKQQLPPVCIGEQATPERYKQQGGVRKKVADRDVTGKVHIEYYKANEECALDHYWRTRKITDRQHTTGMSLRRLSTRINHYASSKVVGSPFASEAGQIDHEWRMLTHIQCVETLNDAYAALLPTQRNVVRNVCGFDIYASCKDDKETLARGLERIARYWENKEKERAKKEKQEKKKRKRKAK